MVLPTFIVCGAQKAGTSTLFQYLKNHLEICMSKHKEVHYFDLNYHNDIKWYEKEFIECQNKKVKAIGEASPFYMYLEEVPERINKILPNVKLIFILRNPVNRAYSHYWHEVRLGYESLSFEEAIRIEEERLSGANVFNKQNYSYTDRGKYVIQIKRFSKFFSQKQMLILINEELKKNPEYVIKRMFEFLEVDTNCMVTNQSIQKNKGRQPRVWKLQRLNPKLPSGRIGQIVRYAINTINLKEGYPKIKKHTREQLLDYFEPYTTELEKFLGIELAGWHK